MLFVYCAKRLFILTKPTGYSHFRGLKTNNKRTRYDTPSRHICVQCAQQSAPHHSTVLSVPEKGIGLPIRPPHLPSSTHQPPGAHHRMCVCVKGNRKRPRDVRTRHLFSLPSDWLPPCRMGWGGNGGLMDMTRVVIWC